LVPLVDAFPLQTLWGESGVLQLIRQANQVHAHDVSAHISRGEKDAIAEKGQPLVWLDQRSARACVAELVAHVTVPPFDVWADDLDGSYCFVASIWEGADGKALLLEKHT
jgi:hypothetical protein